MPAASRPLRPVEEGQRILALDVLRGVALLGIFCVNIQFLARPIADFARPLGAAAAPVPELIAWAAVKILCEFKFISLFSMLFGMGMAVQLRRAEAAGRSFRWLFARRLAVLAVFGLIHALGFWYGDVLFYYALCGLVLLPAAGLRARGLLAAGAAVFLAGAVLVAGLAALQVARGAEKPGEGEAAVADLEGPLEREPFRTVFEVVRAGGPEAMRGPQWSELERIAYGRGSFRAALAVRSVTWLGITLGGAFSFFWRIAALFLLGAGLMKLGVFDAARRSWHRWFAGLGLGLGLPLEALWTWILATAAPATTAWFFAELLHVFASAALCMGYLGAVTLFARSGALAALARGLAAVGRTALSNYLLQTLLATFVMDGWGLGRFDTFGRPAQLLMVFGIFAGQIAGSAVWLRFFRMGPLEWLWRSLTYRQRPPLRRRPGALIHTRR